MKKLLFLFLLIPSILFSQSDPSKGIKWTTNLSWEQVKQKAKTENKYIFVDCYATWCGPCKKMDKEVYTNDTVGNYFNEKFISIKVQMDKTQKDNDLIKSWYNDAAFLNKKYKIEGYPTLVFFSPEGIILDKQLGYQSANEIIISAQIALRPGKVYDDPYSEYDRLVAEFKKGIKDYDKMPYLIKTALKLGDKEIGAEIGKDYLSYLLGLKEEQLYKKENIEFITSNFSISSKSKIFRLFYPDGSKVNSIMNNKGYAMGIVDKVIEREVVDSFTNSSSSGWQKVGDSKEAPVPDWDKLFKIIKEKYDADYADRNVLNAKVKWFRFLNPLLFIENFMLKVKKYGIGTTDEDDLMVNSCSYAIAQNSASRKQVKIALKWMRSLITRHPIEDSYLDTYANLLYKKGKKKDGLKWEEKALEIAIQKDDSYYIQFYRGVIEKMKKN